MNATGQVKAGDLVVFRPGTVPYRAGFRFALVLSIEEPYAAAHRRLGLRLGLDAVRLAGDVAFVPPSYRCPVVRTLPTRRQRLPLELPVHASFLEVVGRAHPAAN